MDPAKVTPEAALGLPPGMALNVFVFEYVLGGFAEGDRIPSCSLSFADCHMVLIKLMADNSEDRLSVSWGDQHFDSARVTGYVRVEKPCPVWRLDLGDRVGYGRSFQEALCKLAIVVEHARGGSR